MILSLQTNAPLTHIQLLSDDGAQSLAHEDWQADRGLAKGIHQHIHALLMSQKVSWEDITAIIVFRGPGSFTGLRIGITVANALGYGLSVPVIGELGDDWLANGLERLKNNANDKVVLPHYGSGAHITPPRK